MHNKFRGSFLRLAAAAAAADGPYTAVIILFCYSCDYDKRTLDNYITQNDVQVVKYTQRRIQKYTDDDDEIRIV